MSAIFNIANMRNITGPFGPSTWYEANDTCEQQGHNLLTIDSQQQEDYVNGTLNPDFGYVHTLTKDEKGNESQQ